MSARRLCSVMFALLHEGRSGDEMDELLHGKRRWRETLPAHEVVWEEVSA